MNNLDPEDFTLVDRIAAALYRGDSEYARELVAEERGKWLFQGARDEAESRAIATKARMEFEKACDAWFETKDGLRVKDKIGGSRCVPLTWKRACQSRMPGIVDAKFFTSDAELGSIEVRTYEHQGYERDGLPIYREI